MEDSTWITNLVSLIKDGGPTALATICMIFWWLERSERIKIQTRLIDVLESQARVNNVWLSVLDRQQTHNSNGSNGSRGHSRKIRDDTE